MSDLEQYCRNCGAKMEEIKYISDDDYLITRSDVFISDKNKNKKIGNLIYCLNCGEIRVNLSVQ